MIELFRRPGLDDLAVEHDRHPIGDRERFFLIVGHQHGGHPGLAQDLPHVLAHRCAQVGIEVGKRLVEQDHLRLRSQGAGQRHALLLPPRELVRSPLSQTGQPDRRQRRRDPGLAVRGVARQAERDVARHAEMGEEGVILEDHADPAPLGWNPPAAGSGGVVDAVPADLDRPGMGPLEPGDDPQRRRLAAAAGSEQGQKLAALDVEIDAAEHLDVAVALLEPAHAQGGHRSIAAGRFGPRGARAPQADDQGASSRMRSRGASRSIGTAAAAMRISAGAAASP